jgi:hypothetical protein
LQARQVKLVAIVRAGLDGAAAAERAELPGEGPLLDLAPLLWVRRRGPFELVPVESSGARICCKRSPHGELRDAELIGP